MTQEVSTPLTDQALPDRLIGASGGLDDADGPILIVTGAIHGNEPAGFTALQRVFSAIESREISLKGRLIGLFGNRRAYAQSTRYLSHDLNRGWKKESIAKILTSPITELSSENLERRELLDAMRPHLESATEPIIFLDLHSTSGKAQPFACIADVLRNRPIAFDIKIPIVLGLEEVIDGTMLGYFCDLGHIGLAVEGGQHDDPRTIDHHEAVVWSALVAAGAIETSQVPEYERHRRILDEAVKNLPSVFEICHRHVIAEDDDYVMAPGFENFVPCDKGQLLAHDRRGPVLAPEDGYVMLPRYQKQGDDGYFLARPLSKFWLKISALVRKLRLDRLIPLLPGISKHPEHKDRYVANPRVAKYRSAEIVHLFGYRRERHREGNLVFSRRRPDFRSIKRIKAWSKKKRRRD